MRRAVETLQRQITRMAKASGVPGGREKADTGARPSGGQTALKQLRFSAQRLAAHRAKLGLSAEHYGKLVGASALSVYKWEKGQVRPRRAQIEALAAVRALGKREAMARLAG